MLCHRPLRAPWRARPDRSAVHLVAQVKHPVAPDHRDGILQQELPVDRSEVALAGPEHDGHDVHALLVKQACGKHLAPRRRQRALGRLTPIEFATLETGRQAA